MRCKISWIRVYTPWPLKPIYRPFEPCFRLFIYLGILNENEAFIRCGNCRHVVLDGDDGEALGFQGEHQFDQPGNGALVDAAGTTSSTTKAAP